MISLKEQDMDQEIEMITEDIDLLVKRMMLLSNKKLFRSTYSKEFQDKFFEASMQLRKVHNSIS